MVQRNNPKSVELNQLRQISKRQEANKYPGIGKFGNSYSKNAVKMCQKYSMFFVLSLLKAKTKVEIYEIQNRRSFVKTLVRDILVFRDFCLM